MKEEQKNIGKLRKWLEGEASLSDERALDKAASEDEFLQDALDGYRAKEGADHQGALGRIKQKVRRQNGSRRPSLGIYYRLAAAATVVFVSLLAIRFLIVPQPQDRLGDLPTTAEAPSPKLEQPNELSEEDYLPADTIEPDSEENAADSKSSVSRERRREPAVPFDQSSPAGETVPPEMVADEEESELVLEDPEQNAAKPAVTEMENLQPVRDSSVIVPNRVTPFEDLEKDLQPLQSIAGRVVDDQGEPLVGVSIYDDRARIGTITDLEGRFQMNLAAPANQLTVSHLGYQPQTIHQIEADTLFIRLTENTVALSEVVSEVTAPAGNRSARASKAKKIRREKADPDNSRFENYLASNLRYPPVARTKGTEGEVVLEFEVNKRGRPVNITIIKPLPDGCTQEAVRLLMEGPPWPVVRRRNDRRRTCSISFRL